MFKLIVKCRKANVTGILPRFNKLLKLQLGLYGLANVAWSMEQVSRTATSLVVFILFARDEKKEAKRRRLKDTCVLVVLVCCCEFSCNNHIAVNYEISFIWN